MQLKIEKEAYFDVEKISMLKSHTSKITKKEIKESKLDCVIEINLSYLNVNGEECFKALSLDCNVDLDDFDIIDIKILQTKIYVIESLGVNVDYILEVDYDSLTNPIIEIVDDNTNDKIIDDNNEINDNTNEISDEEEIEKIKENISKDYENKLLDSLSRKENNSVKIITTKDDRSELEFIKFFNFEERGFHLIKTLYCPNDEALNEISKKYQIDFNILLKGYDRVNKRVIFNLNE